MTAIDLLTAHHIRPSHQRVLILDTLMHTKSHPSAEALYSMVNSTNKGMPISLATFYNTLGLLTDRGIIAEIGCSGSRRHYDACTEPHTHFVCTRCGRILDIDVPMENLPMPEGFQVDKVLINMTGICPDCRE